MYQFNSKAEYTVNSDKQTNRITLCCQLLQLLGGKYRRINVLKA